MNKFEYKVLTLTRGGLLKGLSDTEWEEQMNNLGKEGWELVGVSFVIPLVNCIFKRQIK